MKILTPNFTQINKNACKTIKLYIFDIFLTGAELDNQLSNWLDKADLSYGPARGIIAVLFQLIYFLLATI